MKSKTNKYLSLIESGFLNPGFEYWFTNHKHIRSPFTKEIETEARKNTRIIFIEWINGLTDDEPRNIPEHELVEMFETILFNEAMKLTDDEDQRLTISYPFMPRVGDIVEHNEHGKGRITDRKIAVTKANKKMFEVTVASINDSNIWKTQFELTA